LVTGKEIAKSRLNLLERTLYGSDDPAIFVRVRDKHTFVYIGLFVFAEANELTE